MTANEPVADFIIIGLDFGTTWDPEFNNCSDVEKAPTQLLYDGQKGTSWGYSIPAHEDALKWFKLLLLDNDDVPIIVSKSSQMRYVQKLLDKMKKDPVEVIAYYLRKIWNHAIDSIQRTVGAELLQKSPFHVVITLPTIWHPYDQQRMKQAAKASGMLDARSCGETKLRFISEPEAAALATIKDLSKRSTIKAGDAMVICDAGGGTVDLISYQIESISPFVVKECVKGDGGLCGGVFLDEQFLELIKRKLTPRSWDNVTSAEEKKFLNEWIGSSTFLIVAMSRAPVESSNGERRLNLARKLHQRQIVVLDISSSPYRSDILSAYTPIVDKIELLIRRQTQAVESKLEKSAKYIILVGGTSEVAGQEPDEMVSAGGRQHDVTMKNGMLTSIHWTRNINLESLSTYTNPLGKVYHELNYGIEMTCEGEIVDFTVHYKDKRVGAHNVDVQFR
ncbi:hypothetical protein LZL87_011307 [Fusarium oxysporum]|nr:hypothetical protein LZL87_011307 [Fusarium oxysporum]